MSPAAGRPCGQPAVSQARQVAERAARLREKVETAAVHRRIEEAALMAELRIMRDDTSQ